MNPNAPASGTVTGDSPSASIVANAIAGAGRPQAPLGDLSDEIYDKSIKEGEGDEPAQPTKEPETPTQVPAPATGEKSADGEEDAELEGYFADEGLEDYEPPAPPTQPTPASQPLPQNFTAEEQYIAANIGQPINVRIKVGDQLQTVQAYSPENLPENFEFATERDRLAAQAGFDRLTRKAESLQADYQNQQQQIAAQEFSNQEDTDIQKDIAFLQRAQQAGKDGLGLFKYAPDDPRFEEDPAVQEMQKVLDFYNQENRSRWEEAQRTGRQFRPLTYRDAFREYRYENPKVGPKQQKEDEERKKITKPLAQAAKSTGDAAPKQQRPKLARNASIDQIIAAYRL
jgi:hypothetical protein